MNRRPGIVAGAHAIAEACDSIGRLRLLVAHRERAYLDVLFDDRVSADTVRQRWEKLRDARRALDDAERSRRGTRRRRRRR